MAVDQEELFALALDVRNKAYARYSGFHVGAAIYADNGHIYLGCNVENTAYPLGACAEVGAISAMVADGGRLIKQIAIVGGPKGDKDMQLCSPCGGCRQRIAEFADENTTILLRDHAGVVTRFAMSNLLPGAFAIE